EAEGNECRRLMQIYKESAEVTSATDNSRAPVYQLSWHRITGGRLDNFYTNSDIEVESADRVSFERLRSMRWVVNGVEQPRTLQELIEEATTVLDPNQSLLTVIGHGDAHFGNVFLDSGEFMYFDPAFAGRFSPLLDVTKPLAHNTVLQPWLYF